MNAGAAYFGGTRQTEIRAPTLIAYGDADAVVDPRNSKLLADRIPDSRVVVFPGLGHLFFWEDPAGFAQAVTSFLLSPAEKATGKEAGGDTPQRTRSPAEP